MPLNLLHSLSHCWGIYHAELASSRILHIYVLIHFILYFHLSLSHTRHKSQNSTPIHQSTHQIPPCPGSNMPAPSIPSQSHETNEIPNQTPTGREVQSQVLCATGDPRESTRDVSWLGAIYRGNHAQEGTVGFGQVVRLSLFLSFFSLSCFSSSFGSGGSGKGRGRF